MYKRQVFKVKADPALTTAWMGADGDGKRAILGKVAALPLPAVADITSVAEGVEWHMTATELCALLDAVADLPALQINPGLAVKGDWKAIAFKGGSDGGVLNFSTRLTGKDGRAYCVVATWNDGKALAADSLAGPYRGILRLLAKRGR